MILSDNTIYNAQIVDPMLDHKVRNFDGVPRISYGLSSGGYDIRLSSDALKMFKKEDSTPQKNLFTDSNNEFEENILICDPKNFNPALVLDITNDARYIKTNPENNTEKWVELPGFSSLLGVSVEHFRIPVNVLGTCQGKSTYARCSVFVNITPLEPGWRGYLTIEICNANPHPVKIYLNEGIAQIVFTQLDKQPLVTYDGKYQDQPNTVVNAQV